ncbi:MAG: hypothetical protein ACKVQS_03895 [Fimbriimonadaceae bacterium]
MKAETVILLNKVYCLIRGIGWLGFMGVCFFERANIGLIYETSGETLQSLGFDEAKLAFYLGLFALLSLFFAVINFFLANAPMKKKWWTAHLINHIVGILECCCFPLALPLMLFWIREDVRAMFEEKRAE